MFYFVGFVWFWEIHNGYPSKQKQKLKWVCGEGTLEVQALFKRLGVQRDGKKDPKTKRKFIVEMGVF